MGFFDRRRTKLTPAKSDVQAPDARTKGITRPLPAIEDTQAPQLIRRAHVERSLQQFLSTENWDQTYEVLVREQNRLLTDEARALLAEFIAQTRDSSAPEAAQVADYLEAHLRLLERAGAVGIEPAWREFRATRIETTAEGQSADQRAAAETPPAIDALRRLLSARGLSETRAILESESELLLSDIVDEYLATVVRLASRQHTEEGRESAEFLRLHLQLLRDARQEGIARAWQRFERAMNQLDSERQQRFARELAGATQEDVATALRSLLTTTTWDDTRAVLEREHQLLLTSVCDHLLREHIHRMEREPHQARHVVYLRMHLRLLQLAREDGIDAAWRQFEAAMGIGAASPPAAAAPDEPALRVRDAVRAYLSAASWTSAHLVLLRHRDDLLSELAISLVGAQADQLQANPTARNLYAARLLTLQARLLRRAREIGVERAWELFEREIAGQA